MTLIGVLCFSLEERDGGGGQITLMEGAKGMLYRLLCQLSGVCLMFYVLYSLIKSQMAIGVITLF